MRTISLRMVVILGSILFSVGCSADKGNGTTLVNPVKEVTAEEMTDLTGISLKVPQGAEDIRYNVIEADGMMPMAQMTFTYQENEVFLRAQSVDDTEPVDISGLYYSW